MRIHCLQHVPFEELGYIETWLKEKGYSISFTCFFEENYRLPGPDNVDALIILGGPMSVYDDHQYPWLRSEKKFIRDCILSGKKVFGICLGAQLMAICLGANIYKAGNKEIGWFKTVLTDESKKIFWFNNLFKNGPEVFHWHGEKFEIPQGCINLLSSEANDNQAFYYSKNVIGLQFHLEVTEEKIKRMLENAGSDIVKRSLYIQTDQQIKEGVVYTENCNKIMAEILTNWLGAENGQVPGRI